jgi:hypothetical protein
MGSLAEPRPFYAFKYLNGRDRTMALAILRGLLSLSDLTTSSGTVVLQVPCALGGNAFFAMVGAEIDAGILRHETWDAMNTALLTAIDRAGGSNEGRQGSRLRIAM